LQWIANCAWSSSIQPKEVIDLIFGQDEGGQSMATNQIATTIFALGIGVASGVIAGCSVDATTDTQGSLGSTPGGRPSRSAISANSAVAPNAPPNATELDRMNAFLRNRIDRAKVRKTLQTRTGRNVDCLDVNAQPALRGKPIAKPPAVLAPDVPITRPGQVAGTPEPLFISGTQTPDKCAEGTVPVRDITIEDLKRFASLDEFFRKEPAGSVDRAKSAPLASQRGASRLLDFGSSSFLSQPHAHVYKGVTNWGAEAELNIWNPYTELSTEFSLVQIWVMGWGSLGTESLEVGLQRYDAMYGDSDQHLFIYSTRDAYSNSSSYPGCYNNTCSDFVQVSSNWYPATSWFDISVDGGTQYYIHAHVAKAGDGGDWWLAIDGEWMGYYPRYMYDGVANDAQLIDYGGEAIDSQPAGRHTMTDMGSGYPAAAWWTHAAWVAAMRYHDSNPGGNWITWAETTGLTTGIDEPGCYDVILDESADPSWHTYMYYGGGGYANPGCL
jgi:hypothetical protein